MKDILLLVFFAASVIFTQAQTLKAQDCAGIKRAADTTYSAFDKELQNSFYADIVEVKYDEERKYAAINTFFRNATALINIDDCLTPLERQGIIEKMNKDVGELVAGGVYFFDKKEYDRATESFLAYVDFCRSQIATPENQQNELIPKVEYYAVAASIYANSHQRTVGLLERMIASGARLDDTYELKDLYYFLADEYKKTNNSNKFLEVLEDGILRLPKDKTYFTSIIVNHYVEANDYDKALEYLDVLLKKTRKRSSDYIAYVNIKANLYTHQKKYEEAEHWYKKGLKRDRNSEQLVEGLGVAYAIHAQELKAANNDKNNEKIIWYYKEGAAQLEKYRALLIARNAESVDQLRALSYLRNIYYSLEMYKEFEDTDKLYEKYL